MPRFHAERGQHAHEAGWLGGRPYRKLCNVEDPWQAARYPSAARRKRDCAGPHHVRGRVTSLNALHEFTAQLPRLERLSISGYSKSCFIGGSTKEAMLLGVYRAQIAAAISLAKGQLLELGRQTRVVLTGGGAEDIF